MRSALTRCSLQLINVTSRTLWRRSVLQNSLELRLFTWRRVLTHDFQGVHMGQSQDRGGDEPRQTEQGLNKNRDRENKQVQMIAELFLTERIIVRSTLSRAEEHLPLT